MLPLTSDVHNVATSQTRINSRFLSLFHPLISTSLTLDNIYHISAKYETRSPEGRVAKPNPSRVSADEAKIREKRSLLSRGRKAVKKNATFNLSDIEKRLRDVEERYVLFPSLRNSYSIAQETDIKNPKVTRIKVF